VILWGVLAATAFTLVVVPAAYSVLARYTGSPGAVKRRLQAEMETEPGSGGTGGG
jgi:multidrug efflux pump